jgi:iron complex outermembrane recepter protein
MKKYFQCYKGFRSLASSMNHKATTNARTLGKETPGRGWIVIKQCCVAALVSLTLSTNVNAAISSSHLPRTNKSTMPNAIEQQATRYTIKLPAQTVADSLNALANQTGAQFLFPYQLAKARPAKAVSGKYTIVKAVEHLLEGSGLVSGFEKGILVISVVGDNNESAYQNYKGMREMNNRKNLLAAMIALVAGGGVQTTMAQGDAGSADDPRWLLEEVTVTATKRKESLQDTPISIAALDASSLEKLGISGIGDIGNNIPNLNISRFPTSQSTLRIFIRGIGINDVQITQDPSVGVYLNGVYVARSTGMALDVADLERIEVLRGPQGTLYGRNSIGGAINLITVPPSFEDLSAKQSIHTGNRDYFKTRTIINAPLNDQLSAKLVYLNSEKGGYVKNASGPDFYDAKDEGGRFDLRWLVNDEMTVDYAYDFSRNEIVNPTYQAIWEPGGDSLIFADTNKPKPFSFYAPLSGLARDYINFTPNEHRLGRIDTQQEVLPSDTNVNGHSLVFSWETESLTFKSITAYREVKEQQYAELGSGAVGDFHLNQGATNIPHLIVSDFLSIACDAPLDDIIFDTADCTKSHNFSATRRKIEQNQFSQELQLLGDINDKFSYVVGMYYFEEEADEVLPLVVQNAFAPPQPSGLVYQYALSNDRLSIDNSAWAAYGQTTFTPDILEQRLRLTMGIRYTEDSRKAHANRLRETLTVGAGLEHIAFASGAGRIVYDEKVDNDFDNTSYEVILGYDVSDDINTYAKVTTGYKSGGYNTRSPDEEDFVKGFDQEEVISYEMGLKGELWDKRLRLNVAAFYTEYDDIQLNLSATCDACDVTDSNVFNGGAAEASGAELDIMALLTEGLIATLSYAYLDADYEKVTDTRERNDLQKEYYGEETKFLFTNAPQHTYTIGLDYTFTPTPIGIVTGSLNYNWVDERYGTGDAFYKKRSFMDDHGLLNARLTLSNITVGGGDMSVALWGKNLENKEYVVDAVASFPHASRAVLFGEPRSYGIDLVYQY